MKKRAFLTPVWAVMILILLCSCGTPRYHYETRRDLSVYFTNGDSVIQSVREALKEHSRTITITYRSESGTMEDIPALVNEIMTFAVSETDDPSEGDYIYHRCGGYETEYVKNISDSGSEFTVYIKPLYYTTPEQEQTVTRRVKEIINSLDLNGKSDTEKIRAVYDYVYNNVEYDSVHKKNEHYKLKTTAYGALENGCAVCEGYAALMYRLLREAGISTRVITGMADGEYHAWNIACTEGYYYNIDVTWDKLTGTHDRFMKCEEEFSKDHIRDESFSIEEFYRIYPMGEKGIEYQTQR